MRARPPSRPVSLTEANQQLSRLVGEAEAGARFVITRRGRPVARIVPHEEDRMRDFRWVEAYERMKVRIRAGAALGGMRIEDRDALHDMRIEDRDAMHNREGAPPKGR